MPIKIIQTPITDVFIIEPPVYNDSRGFFMETYNMNKYERFGITDPFVQDNRSRSSKNILRGLHYQLKHPQGKLIYVISGEILDVAVDIRKNSPTFGKYVSIKLSSENNWQLFIPKGFAHGFYVVSDVADVVYKCTDFYRPEDEYGVFWADKSIKIDWQIDNSPIVSEKDSQLPSLNEIGEENFPLLKF